MTYLNISDFSEKHNRFFLHGMPTFTPTDNTLFRGRHLHEKISSIRCLQGAVSASTFVRGENHSGYDFGGALRGVVLGDGDIAHASSSDSGTRLLANGERHIIGDKQHTKEIEQTILKRQSDDPYNEIVVKNPKIAGSYIVFDSKGDTPQQRIDAEKPWPTFNDVAFVISLIETETRNSVGSLLPVFAVMDGQLRQIYGLDANSSNRFALTPDGMDQLRNGMPLNTGDQQTLNAWNNFCAGKTHKDVLQQVLLLGPPMEPQELKALANTHQLTAEQQIAGLDTIRSAWDPSFHPHIDTLKQQAHQTIVDNTVKEFKVPFMSAQRIVEHRQKRAVSPIPQHSAPNFS